VPFCASCGSAVEGKFCAKCGTAVAGSAPSGSPAATPPPVSPGGAVYATSGMADNVASALCYALGLITGVLFLIIAPYNTKKNIRFHAFQSIFLCVAAIVVSIGAGIVFTILGGILGFWITFMLGRILNLIFLVIWIYMIVSAYQGKTVVIPVIGPLAQQQA